MSPLIAPGEGVLERATYSSSPGTTTTG
jgi:hypothetical protein